jgi:hypothetical protein
MAVMEVREVEPALLLVRLRSCNVPSAVAVFTAGTTPYSKGAEVVYEVRV